MIDIIVVVFILLLGLRGKSHGLVKTALGMLSFIVCGLATVYIYNYIDEMGIISVIEERLFSVLNEQITATLTAIGIMDYIVSVAVGIVLYLLVRLLYKLLLDLVSFTVPKGLNSLLGFVFGIAQGLAVVISVLAIVYFASGAVPELVEYINETTVVSKIYYNNPIILFI